MPKRKPCLARIPCLNALFILPVGGVIGLLGSIVGFVYLRNGFDTLAGAFESMGVTIGLAVGSTVRDAGYLIVSANLVVALYGFREKTRVVMNCLGHLPTFCVGWLVKFGIKTTIHFFVSATLLLSFILSLLMEAIYVLFLSMDAACDSAQDTVQDTLDLLENVGFSVDSEYTADKICGFMDEGKKGAMDCFIGVLILTVAQVVVLAYWMKYSTLAMVPAYYTTGVYSKDYVTTGKKEKEKGPELEGDDQWPEGVEDPDQRGAAEGQTVQEEVASPVPKNYDGAENQEWPIASPVAASAPPDESKSTKNALLEVYL